MWKVCADQMLLFIRMKPNLKYIVMIKQKATISPTFFLKVAINTITWVWTKSLIIHTVTFRAIVNVEKIYCYFFLWLFFLWLFFLWLFFLLVLWLFILWLFFRLPFMYCIYNISFIGRDVLKSNIRFIEISWKDKLLSASVIFGS